MATSQPCKCLRNLINPTRDAVKESTAWWGKMITKGPQKPGQGLDRASLGRGREKVDQKRLWPGLRVTGPYPSSRPQTLAVCQWRWEGTDHSQGQVACRGPRQNFKMDIHPSTLAEDSQYMHKTYTSPSLSRACLPGNGYSLSQCQCVPVEALGVLLGQRLSLPCRSSVVVTCLVDGFVQCLVTQLLVSPFSPWLYIFFSLIVYFIVFFHYHISPLHPLLPPPTLLPHLAITSLLFMSMRKYVLFF